MSTEVFMSAACEHPTAQQAVLTPPDIARAARHPHGGKRPEWSGYCLFPSSCACSCHLNADEIEGLISVSFALNVDLSEPITMETAEDVFGGCRCGARWVGESICHCATCHLTFGSLTGFDDHRDRRGEGRCRDEAELRKRGYEPNEDGHWRRPMSQSARNKVRRNEENIDG